MEFLRSSPMSNSQTFDSGAYWVERYRSGGNSGAGSYGRLAVYKAHIIHELVHRREIKSVIEFGSGDGNQANLLQLPSYIGVDLSERMIEASRIRFALRAGWSFLTAAEFEAAPQQAQMTMSLDVIYHLIEDAVFDRYMHRIFSAASQYVLIYASDHDEQASARHVRHRHYSAWIEAHQPTWQLANTWEQPFPLTKTTNPQDTTFAFFRLFSKRPEK
jgi:SAM-dependent methyltransferase